MPNVSVIPMLTLHEVECIAMAVELPYFVSTAGASFEAMNVEQICRQARRLGGKPARICQREPEIVEQVARGTNSSLEWCAMEFETERWNCASHSPRQRAALKNTLSLSE